MTIDIRSIDFEEWPARKFLEFNSIIWHCWYQIW